MQKLNYKIIVILGAVLVVVAVLIYLIPSQNKKTENAQTSTEQETERKALEEVGIKEEKAGNIFAFINPFSTKGQIEYLAPKDDSLKNNVGFQAENNTLLIKKYEIATGKITSTDKEIIKPTKVIWSESGALAYLSSNQDVYYFDKSRSNPVKIETGASDVAFSPQSGLIGAMVGQRLYIFSDKDTKTAPVSVEAAGGQNSVAAVENGLIYKTAALWQLYNGKTALSEPLNAVGDTVAQYSSGNLVILGQEDLSSVYNYKEQTKTTVEGNINSAIVQSVGGTIIFAGSTPGQSEDQTTLFCLNGKTNEIVRLYQSGSTLDSFEASSGVLIDNNFYFTWGNQLSSLRINDNTLAKCQK